MHFQSAILASAALLVSASAIPTDAGLFEVPSAEEHALFRRQYPVLACSKQTGGVHVIAAGGANTDNPKDYGLLGSLSASILNAIPGSSNVSLPYDKVFAVTSPTPRLSPNAIPDGMKTFKTYIINYHHACPNTKMVFIGYSSGAIIQMNALCYGGNGVMTPQINPQLSLVGDKIVIATVGYGDETRNGYAPFNKGTCTSNYNGEAPRDSSKCYPFSGPSSTEMAIQSYCDLTDPDCCTGSGNSVPVHLGYPAKYDGQATQFVVEQFQKYGY